MNSTIYKSLCAIALSSAMAFSASAEIIHSDLYELDDKRTTTDTETGLTFLKLTETIGQSINMVEDQLSTTYKGFRLATQSEIGIYLTHIFENTLGYSMEVGASPDIHASPYNNAYYETRFIGGLFRQTSTYSSGYAINDNGEVGMYGAFIDRSSTVGNYRFNTYYAYERPAQDKDYIHTFQGVWLVSSASDVPAPLALSSLSLLAFGLVRRKKKME